MYEEQFGFNKRPFRAAPHGAEVFVGPQTAQTMQSLKKALTSSDAVVTVTGPAGSGKTTQVLRALEAIDPDCTCIRIGRMHLGPDEILEFLLAKLGVQSPPASTIRRVVFFRAAVMKLRLAGHRVFIVVEDAQRLGFDALAELEALTGAESGDGDGANLVLMAPQSLKPLLRSDGLERLDQRVRLRHRVTALNEAELRAYMKHCFRLAGVEFELIFTDGAAKHLYHLSGGIPRVANNLAESVLAAAAERGEDRIEPDLVAEIAGAEYEMTVETRVPSLDEPEAPAAEEAAPAEDAADVADEAVIEESVAEDAPEVPVSHVETVTEVPALPVVEETADISAAAETPEEDPAVAAEPVDAATAGDDDPVDDEPVIGEKDEPDDPLVLQTEEPTIEEEPVAEFAQPETAAEASPDDRPAAAAEDTEPEPEIPDLIQDTLPDLEVLAPEVMERSAISDAEMDAEEIPTLYSSMRMTADLAEPPELPDDGNVFVGTEAELLPASEPATGEPNLVSDEPPAEAPSLEIADTAPEAAAPAPELELALESSSTDPVAAAADDPPVVDIEEAPELELEPAAEPEAEPVTAAPVQESSEPAANAPLPASPDVLAAVQDEPASAPDDVPAWDRDPTLAELKPDIEALEDAMADMTKEAEPPPVEKAEEPPPEIELKNPTIPSLPEITLDAAIEEKIREAEEALEKHDATIAEDEESPVVDESASDEEHDPRANAELEQIAEGLARAKTIEDVDDKMAETLFGAEISLIAAQVALAKPANEPVAEEQPTAGKDAPAAALSETAPEPAAQATPPEPESEFEKEFREVYGENVDISLETKPKPGMDLSASQRLATVRALNAGIVQPPETAVPEPVSQDDALEPPAPIEDQIDTSLSQRVKALDIDGAALIDDEEDEDDNDGKRGFFSRFRRS